MCRTMSVDSSSHRHQLCANPRCSFLVRTNPAFGGCCCRVCHWACGHRLACLVLGHQCQGCEVLDPEMSRVERAPLHLTPHCPLRRGWLPPFGAWLAAQDVIRTHSLPTAGAVHLSTKTHGVADASGGVITVDLGGASAPGPVSLVVLHDVAADALSRRGMVLATPLLPVPKLKPMDRRGRKRLRHDV